MPTWDPTTYLRFADERARPFFDLLSRVRADAPSRVVDLGGGPGNLTAVLTERWPGADVHGVDSSAEMIEQAAAGPRLSFEGEYAAALRTAYPEQDGEVVLPFRRVFAVAHSS